MSRPLIVDPTSGDSVEQPTCDLCESTTAVVDEPVGGYGSPVHFVVLDLCATCREQAWDKAEVYAGESIDRDRQRLEPDVRDRIAHMERMGKLPAWPPRALPDWRVCRVCRAPSCDCDREPQPADHEREVREHLHRVDGGES